MSFFLTLSFTVGAAGIGNGSILLSFIYHTGAFISLPPSVTVVYLSSFGKSSPAPRGCSTLSSSGVDLGFVLFIISFAIRSSSGLFFVGRPIIFLFAFL